MKDIANYIEKVQNKLREIFIESFEEDWKLLNKGIPISFCLLEIHKQNNDVTIKDLGAFKTEDEIRFILQNDRDYLLIGVDKVVKFRAINRNNFETGFIAHRAKINANETLN